MSPDGIDWVTAVSQVGFPITIALILVLRNDKLMREVIMALGEVRALTRLLCYKLLGAEKISSHLRDNT